MFVQKREQSSTAVEAMQAAEAIGVLPFVFLNSELCELKGEAVIITQGNLQTGHTLSYFLTCAVSGSESLYL